MKDFIDKVINKIMWLKNKGAFHIVIGSFLTKFVSFFGSIFIVRILTKEQFGVLGYVENIYSYIYIFAGMGLMYSILRYVVLAEEFNKKYGYFKYAVKNGLIFNIILVIVVAICVLTFSHPAEFKAAKWLIVMSLVALPFQHLTDDNVYTYRAMFSNKRFAIASFIVTSSLIASRYIGAVFWGLYGVITAKITVYIIFAVVLSWVTYKTYFIGINPLPLDKKERLDVNKYSIQYMITNGIWAIFMLNDIFLLGQLLGDPKILADYKVAYILPGNIAIISTAIGIFVGPYFVKNENNYSWVKKNYMKTLGITASAIGLISILLYSFAKPIITLLYGIQYMNVVPIMKVLTLAAFANCGLRFTTAHVLASMGHIKYNMIISFVGMFIQVIANLQVIPKYGVLGVAWTSVVVYTFMAIALFLVFSKKFLCIKSH